MRKVVRTRLAERTGDCHRRALRFRAGSCGAGGLIQQIGRGCLQDISRYDVLSSKSKFGLVFGLAILPMHRAQSHTSIAANSECFAKISCPAISIAAAIAHRFDTVDGHNIVR